MASWASVMSIPVTWPVGPTRAAAAKESVPEPEPRSSTLGLRANLAQFSLLVGVNALVSQGLTWSTTVIMKIDLAGPHQRGLAMGLNEAAGYGAVALSALATGIIAAHAGLRPEPFFLGLIFAGLGLGLSGFVVRETRGHARHEASDHDPVDDRRQRDLTPRDIAVLTSVREHSLSAACQAGLVNNLNDGLAWGLFPLLFAHHALTVAQIGALAALYPAVWGLGQLVTG